MASDFDNLFGQSAVDALFDQFGDETAATVTTPDGTATPDCKIMLDDERQDQGYDELGQQTEIVRNATFDAADIADVPPKSTVVAAGQTWRVAQVVEKNANLITVELRRESDPRRHGSEMYVRTD